MNRIEIPLKLPSLNQYINECRKNRFAGANMKKNIEKDIFYCYYEDKELVEKLKNNMYKELWIISGYKGGYETYKDFGSKLIKDIQVIE